MQKADTKNILWEKLEGPGLLWFLGLIFTAVIILAYATGIGDNDLWWHMKYGEYMLQNKTIKPDHTVFSWTKTDKDWIYVTWLPDILFYLMYQFGGIPLLVIFRYLCVAAIAVLFLRYGMELSDNKISVFSLLIVLIVITKIAGSANYLKPELFSIVLFSLALYIYFHGKEKDEKTFYFYPLIFLVWVNTHGVFIFGGLLITILLVGEVVGYVLNLNNAITKNGLKALSLSVFISYAATLVNPYGFDYHIYLIKSLSSPEFAAYAKEIQAMLSPMKALKRAEIFGGEVGILNFVNITIALMAIFGIASIIVFFKRRILHLPLILINLVFAALFFKYIRTSFFYPLVWGFSMLKLSSYSKLSGGRKAIVLLCILLFLVYAGMLLYVYSSDRVWLGIGVSDYLPEKEVSFLKKYDLLKYPIFNEYYIGGYLLWALYPGHKVFIDPRGGPYLNGVMQDYQKAFYIKRYSFDQRVVSTTVDDVKARESVFKEFTAKYPFKVAVIQLGQDNVIFPFLLSEDWRLTFFDSNAVIFTHKSLDLSNIREDLGPKRFTDIKSFNQLMAVFTLYLNMNDINSATYILNVMKKNFSRYKSNIEYAERMLRLMVNG